MMKFELLPSWTGFAAEKGAESISEKLDGGLSEYSKDKTGASSMVDCVFNVYGFEQTYLWSFYRATEGADHGSMPFLITLWIEGEPAPSEFVAFFNTPPRVTGIKGPMHTVQTRLEVKPLPEDHDWDDAVIGIGEAYGVYDSTAGAMFNLLADLVNVHLPELAE